MSVRDYQNEIENDKKKIQIIEKLLDIAQKNNQEININIILRIDTD